MTDRIKLAEMDYLSGMKYKDIAKKYDVSINTVKSWKRRCNWRDCQEVCVNNLSR